MVLVLLPCVGKAFMPSLQEGIRMFHISGIPSASLEESIRVSNVVDAKL